MFSGLVAFPLTPVRQEKIDERAFVGLLDRLVAARVDSICALGSTGSSPYLTRAERARATQVTLERAGDIPVIVGVGALATRDVLTLTEDAQKAGVKAVLLAPVSYHKLTADEVYGLYETVAHNLSVPLIVYDNPFVAHFEFSDELHGRIAQLPNVVAAKVPAIEGSLDTIKARMQSLRQLVPENVSIGSSGDPAAARWMLAGCDAWYSVIGGLFPDVAQQIIRAARAGDVQETERLSQRLAPIWELMNKFSHVRVVAAAAELRGLVERPSLLGPVRALEGPARSALAMALDELELA